MTPLSQVSWGPIDALERDKTFFVKWIEPDTIKNCLHPKKWIVTGEKGSGKSAIRKAISEIYRDEYTTIVIVDFNKVEFGPVTKNVAELSKLTQLSSTRTLSNFWQYAIIVELIRECAATKPRRYGRFAGPIPDQKIRQTIYDRIFGLLQDSWNSIDNFTGISPTKAGNAGYVRLANLVASGGLTADLLGELSRYPLDTDYESLKSGFFREIENSRDKVIMIFDGLDRLKVDENSSKQLSLIFASLVDAIHSIRIDEDLPETLYFKVLIPHDRFINIPLRDSDKFSALHTSIRWDRDSLQEFVKKRIEVTTGIKGSNFLSSWRQVLPDHVTNITYNLQEDSFDYILRHSLHRPRHLQMHLEALADRYPGVNIDPTMITKSIGESSAELTRHFVNEYCSDLPNIGEFIQSFHRKDNVMEYKYLREMVLSAFRKHRSESVANTEKIIDLLYEIGFFGIVNFIDSGESDRGLYCPPTRESKKHYTEFFYKTPRVAISGFLSDKSIVALHPIFVHFASLKAHPTLIIG